MRLSLNGTLLVINIVFYQVLLASIISFESFMGFISQLSKPRLREHEQICPGEQNRTQACTIFPSM